MPIIQERRRIHQPRKRPHKTQRLDPPVALYTYPCAKGHERVFDGDERGLVHEERKRVPQKDRWLG